MAAMDFPKVGVKLSYVTREFLEVCGGREAFQGLTTFDVFERYVKPKTRDAQSSYCEMLKARGHEAYGESPKYFISHSHRYNFLDFLSALAWKLRHSPDVCVWIDMFSINQHMPMDWTFDWLSNTFKSAIESMGTTIMVMSPWDNPLPFTRAWCVFEAYCTAVTSSRFEIAMSKTDETIFLEDIKRDAEIRMNEMMSTIRADKCECSVPSDKHSIFEVIESTVGFSKLDSMVFERYREWVLQVSMEAFENCDQGSVESLALQQAVAYMLYNQGKYSEAEVYLRDCIQKSKILLGEDHPDVSARKCRLGRLLTKQGHYTDAQAMLEDCLKRSRRLNGENHVDSFEPMYYLASNCYNQEQYEKARDLYETVYDGRKKLLGDMHVKTLHVMNRLGAVLSNQQEYDCARKLIEECFEKRKEVLGEDHPHTLHSMGRLAVIYYNQSEYDKAECLAESCFQRQKAALGEDHPHTLLTMNRLATLLYQQGKVEEAKAMNALCVEKQKVALGEAHPHTLFSMQELGSMRL